MQSRRTEPLLRFFAKVEFDGCWLWRGARDSGGYGKFRDGHTVLVSAHRWAYEALVGPIPAGLQLDHLCRVHLCVNPDHLEPVTPGENTRRGSRLVTHCPKGHVYDEQNTRVNTDGARDCRQCDREYKRSIRRHEDVAMQPVAVAS